MKTKILILIGIIIMAFACNNDDDSTEPNFEGQYIGTFERNGMISKVELNFNKGNFSGESDRINFPAIYFGSFSVQNNTLNFDNKQLIITTEFDPNLVLNGIWKYQINDNTLNMTNSIGDVYILTKE
ncbi:hypothetical protein P8625_03565 [Tenacibaculum tangerinum]|uniref:Lipocalin-like domain-containing protein n=1 Tax=Tenacibaculum tangerinum TaxID=3038772 RepID=A0ABY8L498_9FLAO|nr:hypothetical protein [Tenacibaculum tangerinum]WGH76256.1 hypothetical protein P8625_03565 [Tenacibaculum tangerinum]